MKKKKDAAGKPRSAYVIEVGFVTPFVVQNTANKHIIAAFHSLKEAMARFPTAEVDKGAWRKAKELG